MILGEALVPQVVTDHLGLSPDQQWLKGERKCRRRRDGTVHYHDSIHEWGGWKKWSSEEERKMEFPALLGHWCALLTPRKKVLAEIRESGSEVFLDCCFVGATESFVVEPDLLAQMADLGLAFRVTFYAHEDGEANQSAETTAVECPPSKHGSHPAVSHL
jgi:hypothetical protein